MALREHDLPVILNKDVHPVHQQLSIVVPRPNISDDLPAPRGVQETQAVSARQHTGFYNQLREAAMADNGITLPVPIIRAHSHGHIIQLLRPGLVIDLAGSGTTGRRTRRGREDDPMCRTKSREILLRHRLKQR